MMSSMRDADRAELIATGVPLDVGMEFTFRTAVEAYAGFADGKLVCVFGVSYINRIANSVAPWNIATDLINRYQFQFARRNKSMIMSWKNKYSIMRNYVHANNKLSIKWLGWLGFTIHEAKPMFRYGELFHEFTMRGN